MYKYDIYYSFRQETHVVELPLSWEIKTEDDARAIRDAIAEMKEVPPHHIYIRYWDLRKKVKTVKTK